MTTLEMFENTQTSFTETLQQSNDNATAMRESQEERSNIEPTQAGTTSDESTNSLLNEIGLAVQRQGGQNAN